MDLKPIQETSRSQTDPADFQRSQIPAPLKVLIIGVVAVASAALGFLLAGLAGLAIGTLAGTGLGFTAILIANNFMSQSQTDLDLAKKRASVTDQAEKNGVPPPMNIGVSDSEGNELEALPIESARLKNSWILETTDCRDIDFTSIPDDVVVEGNEEIQDSTNVRDQIDKDLIQFYNLLPIKEKLHLDASISDQAESIRTWMNQNPKALNYKTLNLARSGLSSLPKEIGLFVHLTRLTLDNNNMQALPPEIGNLHSLKHLTLSDNNLESLPSEIGKLASLEVLNVSSNMIEGLPAEIENLRSLERLDLSINFINDLPSNIGNLPSLQKISLSSNPIRDFPPKINNLEYRGNGVYELPATVK